MNWKDKFELFLMLLFTTIGTLIAVAICFIPAYGLYLLLDKLIDKI